MDRTLIDALGSGLAAMAIFALVWIIAGTVTFARKKFGAEQQKPLQKESNNSNTTHGIIIKEQPNIKVTKMESGEIQLKRGLRPVSPLT